MNINRIDVFVLGCVATNLFMFFKFNTHLAYNVFETILSSPTIVIAITGGLFCAGIVISLQGIIKGAEVYFLPEETRITEAKSLGTQVVAVLFLFVTFVIIQYTYLY